MKKITLLLCLLTGAASFSNIVVRDIPDFTFNDYNELDFDFNNDGTPEFTFSDQGGYVSCYFNYGEVDFYGTGTLATGHGWDIMKSLVLNTPINASATFDAQGDAYINAPWADANEMFPNGDSYVGTSFKIGASRYFGWILVNVNAGVIKVKSYAYNDVANQGINAGQTTSLSVTGFSDFDFAVYPNPATDVITINCLETITQVQAIDVTGRTIALPFTANSSTTENLPAGIYILKVTSDSNKTAIRKIIKK